MCSEASEKGENKGRGVFGNALVDTYGELSKSVRSLSISEVQRLAFGCSLQSVIEKDSCARSHVVEESLFVEGGEWSRDWCPLRRTL